MRDFNISYDFSTTPSPLDNRDFLLESIYPEAVKLPDVLDLRPELKPIKDQGQQGTCSAQTAACMKEWQEKKDVGLNEYMSPQFIYNLRQNQDMAGMYPRDTMNILNKIGIVTEKDYPYNSKKKITDVLLKVAKNYIISGYAKINTIDALKKALFANGPCYITFPIFNANKMDMWNQDFVNQSAIGGHACFTGDTKISLLDGRELSFIELEKEFKNKNFWVYSCDENGKIVPGKAHSPRITRKNANIIKITLDNGEEIKCTEDHKFLLRNGEYKEAKNLSNEDSLMPLYRRISSNINKMHGYEQFLNIKTNKWEHTHSMVAYYNDLYKRIKTNVVHHKNFKKRNNNPDNLQIMDKQEHWKLHMGLMHGLNNWVKSENGRKFLSENAKKMWKENKKFKEKVIEVLKNNGKLTQYNLKQQGRKNPLVEWAEKNQELAKKQSSKNGKENIKKANTKEAKEKSGKTFKKHFSEDIIFKENVLFRANKNFQQYNDKIKSGELKTPEYYNTKKLTALKNAYKNYKFKKYSTFENYLQLDKGLIVNNEGWIVPYNHKIIKKEFYGVENVYDITVEKYHNFALTAGVFVHNCTVVGYTKDSFIIRNSWSTEWGDGGYTYYKFFEWGKHWECWTTLDSESTTEGLRKKVEERKAKRTERIGLFKKLFSKKLKK